jgi:hypothetical protein
VRKLWNQLLFLFVGLPLLWCLGTLWENWRDAEVVASQPIGGLIRMSGATGWGGKVVIETDAGYFPMHEAVTLPKGTTLVLEERGSGRRYVCDLPRGLCVRTSRESFVVGKEGGRP